MLVQPPSVNDSLSLSVRMRLEPICKRFEQAWQNGEWPDMASFLADICAAERLALAWELIRLDAEYRRHKGESPEVEDYRHLGFDSVWLADALCPCESIANTPTDTQSPSSEPSLNDDEAASGRPFGDYLLQEKIGRGAMGIVYKARQQKPVRIVALKQIGAGPMASPEEIERFQTEAQNVAELQHPHIVPIYEVKEHHGWYYFTMPLYERGSLNQHLPRFQKDIRAVARLLATVARAVHYAHQRGILHRDLKPANILLDDKDRPVVADFGLATRVAPEGEPGSIGNAGEQGQDTVFTEPSKSGPICGTIPYMSPEQAEGKRVLSTAVDVYGLGAILYELLTGQPPFKASTVKETLRLVKEEPLTPPRSHNRQVPVELDSICRKCLHKKAEDRYASAEAVADDLERWLRGETPIAHPIGRLRRLVKWAKRRPMLAFLWSAVIVLLLFGAGVVFWHIEQIETAADRIDQQLYLTSIQLAARYIERHHLDRADETLDKCSPALRRWEWYYLKRLCHRDEVRLSGHTASVLSVEYSPDGSRIATAGMDSTVRIWNAATYQQLHTLRGRPSVFVNNACFSNGGRLLISASEDGAVKFWDVATGRELQGLPIKGNQIAVSRRNNVLAALNRDYSIDIWDVVARKNLWTLTGLKERITNIALSPDGQYLAAVGYQEVLRVWNLHERRELRPFIGPDKPIPQRIMFGIAFSSDGNYLVVGAENPLIWNIHTRKASRVYGTGGLRCSRMVFSPDSKWVATICRDGLVRVWDIESETIVLSLEAADQGAGLDFSPDGRHLALSRGREVGIIKNINNTDLKMHRLLEGHSALQVGALAFSPDGRLLASRAGDREIILRDAVKGHVIRTLVAPRKIPSEANLSFSPDGSRLLSGCRGGQLLVWDVKKGQQSVDTIPAPNTLCCVFDPTGKWLATTDGLEILLWNAESKELVRQFDRDTSEIICLAFRPGHRQLASCGSDGLAKLWDMDTGKVVRMFKGGPTSALAWLAFSADGRRMATAGQDLTVRVWDMDRERDPLVLKGHNGPVTRVAFSPDGNRIVSASHDGTVKLWDARFGQELLTFKKNKKGSAACVAFSPDGRLLAAGGHDGTVRVWDGTPLSRTQQP